MAQRIHRELGIEELERRVAPVVLNGTNSVVTFSDDSGDTVQVRFQGPGAAHVRWVIGGEMAVAGDTLSLIAFSDTTERSSLTIRDMDPDLGGNSLVGGTVRTALADTSVGSISFFTRRGAIRDTVISLSGSLRDLRIMGDVDDVELFVGGNLGLAMIRGEAARFDTIVGGSIGQFRTDGDLRISNVGVTGGVGLFSIGGESVDSTVLARRAVTQVRLADDATRVTVRAGSLQQFMLTGDANTLNLLVDGNGRIARITGDVAAGDIRYNQLGSLSVGSLTLSRVVAAGGLGSFMCPGDVINSTVTSVGDMSTCRIGGRLHSDLPGAEGIFIIGNAAQVSVGGLVSGPQILITGNLGSAQFPQAMLDARFVVGGNLGNVRFGGMVLLGNFLVGGDARSVLVQNNAAHWTVAITGNAGTFNVRGAMGRSSVAIGGDARSLMFAEMVTDTDIDVAGAVGQIALNGGMTDTSTLEVDGPTIGVMIRDGLTDSELTFNGGAANMQIFGAVSNSDINATGRMTSFLARGDVLDGSIVTIFGDVGNVNILGALNTGARFNILGQTNNLRIAGGVHVFSQLNLGGTVGTATISAPAGADAVGWGEVRIGILQRSLRIGGNVDGMGLVDIVGSAAGARINIQGDMDGRLLAGVFGDVTISGTFRGVIGDAGTAPGAGNTLRTGTTALGARVNPPNAFAFYA
ncbi:MAG: hypothetical protein AB1696_04175 [Planctomycetota bacterium]